MSDCHSFLYIVPSRMQRFDSSDFVVLLYWISTNHSCHSWHPHLLSHAGFPRGDNVTRRERIQPSSTQHHLNDGDPSATLLVP